MLRTCSSSVAACHYKEMGHILLVPSHVGRRITHRGGFIKRNRRTFRLRIADNCEIIIWTSKNILIKRNLKNCHFTLMASYGKNFISWFHVFFFFGDAFSPLPPSCFAFVSTSLFLSKTRLNLYANRPCVRGHRSYCFYSRDAAIETEDRSFIQHTNLSREIGSERRWKIKKRCKLLRRAELRLDGSKYVWEVFLETIFCFLV